MTPRDRGCQTGSLSTFKRILATAASAILALSIVLAPVGECFTPPPGAEMPCCLDGHHDEACLHSGGTGTPGDAGAPASIVECCRQAEARDLYGISVAKFQAPDAVTAAVLPFITDAAPPPAPLVRPLTFDTGPPGSSTRRHIVLSVFLI